MSSVIHVTRHGSAAYLAHSLETDEWAVLVTTTPITDRGMIGTLFCPVKDEPTETYQCESCGRRMALARSLGAHTLKEHKRPLSRKERTPNAA